MPPYPEAKLVRCTRGAIVDVAVDVRPESPHLRRARIGNTSEAESILGWRRLIVDQQSLLGDLGN